MELRLSLALLLLPLLPLVAAAENDYIPINIATASNAALNDSWARFIYWQHPNGKIMLQQRLDISDGPKPQEIKSTIAAKPASPLAAFYTSSNGAYNLAISYLDSTNRIISTTCRYEPPNFLNWSTSPTDLTSSSGLALVNAGGVRRRFYVNADDYLVQDVSGRQTPLGPKVAKGSGVAATVPVGGTDVYVFFIPADDATSLASITFDGSDWSETLPLLRNFAPAGNPNIGFAAAAWSDPLIVRLFHINQDTTASEWTFASGSWTDTKKEELGIQGAISGEPVAASQSANGSGRYVEYLYTTVGKEINAVGKNSAGQGFIQTKLTTIEVEEGGSKDLSNEAIIGIVIVSVTILLAAATALGLYFARKAAIERQKSADPQVRDGKPTGFFQRLFFRLWLWIARKKGWETTAGGGKHEPVLVRSSSDAEPHRPTTTTGGDRHEPGPVGHR